MILQKKQFYSNKLFNKHYKKLNHIFFSRKGTLNPSTPFSEEQFIHISILTIDTTSHANFPNIIEISLNNVENAKKATATSQGKTKLPKKFVHLLSAFFCFPSKTAQDPKRNNNNNIINSGLAFGRLKDENIGKQSAKKNQLGPTFETIGKIVGAGINIHHYKVRVCAQPRRKTPLPHLRAEAAAKGVKDKRMLSKTELSRTICQIFHRGYSAKGSKHILFNINTLSNIIGALIVINSTLYYISDNELKQYGLISFKQSPTMHLKKSNNTAQSFLLKKLLNLKIGTKFKKTIAGTRALNPNNTIFNFLKASLCAGIFHDCKKILSRLCCILVKSSIIKKNSRNSAGIVY